MLLGGKQPGGESMKVKQNGTKIYCPHCREIRVCQVPQTRGGGLRSSQNVHYPNHPDIQWFRRERFCNDCSNIFVTAEVNENFLTELVSLRSDLSKIKVNAEQYLKESVSASKSLKKLSKSLSVLRAGLSSIAVGELQRRR